MIFATLTNCDGGTIFTIQIPNAEVKAVLEFLNNKRVFEDGEWELHISQPGEACLFFDQTSLASLN